MPQSGDSEIKRAVGDQAKTATAVPPKEKPVGSACNSASGSASPFKFPAKTKKVRVLKPNKPGDIGYKYPSGEVCPQYQVRLVLALQARAESSRATLVLRAYTKPTW